MSRTSSGSSDPAGGVVDRRGVLVGAMISAGFGIAWSLWGASGLAVHSPLGWIVGAAGAVVGIAIIALAVTAFGAGRGGRRRSGGAGGSMFASRSYRIVVIAEVVAFFAGTQVLARTGHPELIVVWVATVVGVHFLVFGLLFWRGFTLIGAVLVAAAVVGLVLSLNSVDPATVRAVTALVAAADLLAAGAVSVAGVRRRAASAVSVP